MEDLLQAWEMTDLIPKFQGNFSNNPTLFDDIGLRLGGLHFNMHYFLCTGGKLGMYAFGVIQLCFNNFYYRFSFSISDAAVQYLPILGNYTVLLYFLITKSI